MRGARDKEGSLRAQSLEDVWSVGNCQKCQVSLVNWLEAIVTGSYGYWHFVRYSRSLTFFALCRAFIAACLSVRAPGCEARVRSPSPPHPRSDLHRLRLPLDRGVSGSPLAESAGRLHLPDWQRLAQNAACVID